MSVYVPRLSVDGVYLSRYYYGDNIFYKSGLGLPNCTCYAWGRIYEISDVYPSLLPLGDAGTWYPSAISAGKLSVGSAPRLGAIACYASTIGGAGHVAIVEQINIDGSFIISQSGYYRPISDYPPDTPNYFYINECDRNTKLTPWMNTYTFQGFIYNPYMPTPTHIRKKMPLWMYMRHF